MGALLFGVNLAGFTVLGKPYEPVSFVSVVHAANMATWRAPVRGRDHQIDANPSSRSSDCNIGVPSPSTRTEGRGLQPRRFRLVNLGMPRTTASWAAASPEDSVAEPESQPRQFVRERGSDECATPELLK